METKEQIKEHLRAMTAEQIEAQEMECQKILFYYAGVTVDDRAEARLILQAIEELEQEREQQHQEREQAADEIATALEQAGREVADERQAQIMARALQINEDRKAAAQEPQQITQPERVEKTKAEIRAVLRRGFLAHFEEYYSIVAQTAKTRKAGAGKRAAAQMLLAAYNAHGLINEIALPYFTNWLDLWYPITGIRGSDDNYKASKLDAGYYLPAEKFSPDLRAILYPDINQ